MSSAPSAPFDGGVEGVLFDYGLTLVWFERPVAAIDRAQRVIAACLTRAGHHAPPVDVLRTAVHDRVESEVMAHEATGALEEVDVGALEAAAFADLGLNLDDSLRDRCAALAQEAWLQGVRLYPDVVGTLTSLRRGGLRVGICSNAAYRPASMRDQLRHLGIATLLDAAVFSSEVGWRKPSPRIFEAALDTLHLPPARCVFVGDRVREDVEGARGAGMRTILLVRAPPRPPGFGRADAVIRSLEDIVKLLGLDTRL